MVNVYGVLLPRERETKIFFGWWVVVAVKVVEVLLFFKKIPAHT